ncbi:restriction endonuclease [Priestia megaterium]|uniref:restriction endonuclease n=1 Tax=Priestia megaterium TaxID=1404 RepID=UPI0009E2AE98|nr:restriction endonuclease [Priestia megaterium]
MVRRVVLVFFAFVTFIFTVNIILFDSDDIIFLIPLAIIAIITIDFRIKANNKRQSEYEKELLQSGISQVDSMNGRAFEDYLAIILKAKGYNVQQTQASGDYGADLILSANGIKIAVQAKRYSKKVGIKAVQEISSAKNYYGVKECWVITNNYFTAPAINLATSNEVKLIDRDQLVNWMAKEKNRT